MLCQLCTYSEWITPHKFCHVFSWSSPIFALFRTSWRSCLRVSAYGLLLSLMTLSVSADELELLGEDAERALQELKGSALLVEASVIKTRLTGTLVQEVVYSAPDGVSGRGEDAGVGQVPRGSFRRIDVVEVQVETGDSLERCLVKWADRTAPKVFARDSGDELELEMGLEATSVWAARTGGDCYFFEPSARIGGIAGGYLPEVLQKLDSEEVKKRIERRGVVFRSPSVEARSHEERGVFLSMSHLLSLGGSLPSSYVQRSLQLLGSGDCRVTSRSEGGSRILKISRTLGGDSQDPLVVEAQWGRLDGHSSYLLESYTSHLVGAPEDDVPESNSYWSMKWIWNTSSGEPPALRGWEFFASDTPKSPPSFKRTLAVETFQDIEKSDFTVRDLGAQTGDLIYDTEKKLISYIPASGGPVNTQKIVVETSTAALPGRRFAWILWFNLAIVSLAAAWWALTKLRRSP